MAEFMQGLDPGKLVLTGATLAFIISPFSAPAYNLPVFLFGSLVHETSGDALQSLKLFIGILSTSIVTDIIWMFNNEQSTFIRLLFILLWLLKIPTILTFSTSLRQRGSQFMGIGADISGPTVWSMPGGFTSAGRDGYQVVDDEPPRANNAVPRPPAPPPKASSSIVAPAPQVHPGNYQNA